MVCRVVRRRRQVEKILLGVGKKSIIYDGVKVEMILLKKYSTTRKIMLQLEENVNRLVTRGWSTYS